MRKDNPACRECLKGKDNLHTWRRNADTTATCLKCEMVLNPVDAAECFGDYDTAPPDIS